MKITLEFASFDEMKQYLRSEGIVPEATAIPEMEEQEPAGEPEPAAEEPEISMESLRAALADLNELTGENTARRIIQAAGYNRFTEVPEADYPKILEAMKAVSACA